MTSLASPNIHNYRLPGAKIYAKLPSDPDFVDLGNLVDGTYTPTVERKEHFSSMSGTRIKDFSIVSQIAATIALTLDELTARNLQMFFLAQTDTGTDGDEVLYPLLATDLTADIKIVGTNTTGPQIDFEGNVTFIPAGDFNLQADNDDWAQLPLTADVNKDAQGRFGRIVVRAQEGITA